MSSVKIYVALAVISVLLIGCDGTALDVDNNTAPGEQDTENPDGIGGIDGTTGSTSGIIEEDDFYWAELAQSFPAFVVPPEIGAAHDAADNINLGRWGDVIEWPQIATGAAHLPDGRLLTWSSTGRNSFGAITIIYISKSVV